MIEVQMTLEDWREAAEDAKALAVAALRDPDRVDSRSHRLIEAAELLRACDTLNGRANVMSYFEESEQVDRTEVEDPVPA